VGNSGAATSQVRTVKKLVLAYDGTDYVGWQRQADGTSIQGLLEEALLPIEGTSVTVHGAGRTDAGVHALRQVASVSLTASLDTVTLARALNAVLPPDVRVLDISDAPPDFHARFSATGKIYQYRIVNGPTVSPFIRRFVWHVIPRLDFDAVRMASKVLTGTHDFAAFQGAGTSVSSTERTIRRLEWRTWTEPIGPDSDAYDSRNLIVEIEGDGFLRHMVRTIVGTLVEIGLGRWPAADVAGILASRDRSKAGTTAPAQGLLLKRVLY
jgi:tRNA pseudouridine38-40 synthase